MAAKRTKLDIIGDMLKSIRDKGGLIRPTHLMYKSNLSHVQMQIYLKELIEKDLIRKLREDDKDFFSLTDKGYGFITRLNELTEFERTFGL